MNDISNKPIIYHVALIDTFDDLAEECGWEPHDLREASENAICSRHGEAITEPAIFKHGPQQPDIYRLSLGSVQLIYTVESDAVVIRGYTWEIEGEPRDDFDGGGFYCEAEWWLRR